MEISTNLLLLATGIFFLFILVAKEMIVFFLNIKRKRKFIENLNEILRKKQDRSYPV